MEYLDFYPTFNKKVDEWVHRAMYIPFEEELKFDQHKGKIVSNFDGFHLYFKDERISQYNKFYVMKYRLHAQGIVHDSETPFCGIVERKFQNEPVHLFTKFVKYKVRVPKKLDATKVRSGFRYAYVEQYTVRESYTEEKVNSYETARELMKDFYTYHKEVLAKIQRNDKFLKNFDLNPLKNNLKIS